MAIQAGLVGLPNVGKSTLFNALTKSSIPAENYPFCTVDPHIAITHVPDTRLTALATIFNSQKIIPTTVQFVDIAGLVKGASQGEGLGNQFLSNVMSVDLIMHVVRCFNDARVTHVHNHLNPLDDYFTILTELSLKDLESIEKREQKLAQLIKKFAHDTRQKPLYEKEHVFYQSIKPLLEKGDTASIFSLVKEFKKSGGECIPLLTAKNFVVIANISEEEVSNNAYTNNIHYQALIKHFGVEKVIPVSAKIEGELAQMSDEEAAEMMETLEMKDRGLTNIITSAYENLGMISFYTCGPKEAHAWSIPAGTKVPQAGGAIHSDLERGFICAEVYHANDLIELGSESALKAAGKIRTEGKEYYVKDGDVIHIRFNV